MEDLCYLDAQFKNLLQNMVKSEDDFFGLFNKLECNNQEPSAECINLGHSKLTKCLYAVQVFHEYIRRKILEQRVELKELYEDGKPFNNEFEMLRNYVHFENYIEKEIDTIQRNGNNKVLKIVEREGLGSSMVHLMTFALMEFN